MSSLEQRRAYRTRTPATTSIRFTLLAACLGWFTQKYLKSSLLPYGPAIKSPLEERPTYADVDVTNDRLMYKHGKLHMIYERLEEGQEPLLKGPETVLFDNDGNLLALTEDANLVKLSDIEKESDTRWTAKTTKVGHVGAAGAGRPLGGKYAPDGTLYIADAVLGLTRLKNHPLSKLEIVASKAKDKNGNETPIFFADDVVIGPKTGWVYFTDACDVLPERDAADLTWDVMYPSKVELMRGKPTGRLLRYKPESDEVDVLLSDLFFANGIGIDKEEQYVVFAETFGIKLTKYYVAGEKEGTMEYIVNGSPSPAYFDGVDCAWQGVTGKEKHCYAVLPSTVVPAQKLLYKLPHPIDAILRTLLLSLPKQLLPKTVPYGGVIVVDPEKNEVVELFQDLKGEDCAMLTGVTVYGNKLYLGSLHHNRVGVYDLD